jgi:hypothetical protein
MTLERHQRGAGGDRIVMTACPLCGQELQQGYGTGRSEHFRDEHGPEDCGLSPLGERRDDA